MGLRELIKTALDNGGGTLYRNNPGQANQANQTAQTAPKPATPAPATAGKPVQGAFGGLQPSVPKTTAGKLDAIDMYLNT